MTIYFLFIITFFVMLYNILAGIFKIMSEGFWGYYDRIIAKIKKYKNDETIYGQDEVIIKSLEKQKKELEDIMGQYVFFRFCEKMSIYFMQINMVMIFCVSIATVVFVHSAVLNNTFFWAIFCVFFYLIYIWHESSGEFIKFEIWATNLFFRQYKVLSETGGIDRIIETKKKNKDVLRKFYLFFIVPISFIVYFLLNKFIIYPLLPELNFELEKTIIINWIYFILIGILFVITIPVILDKLLNSKLKLNLHQIKESYYAISIYFFLTLVLAIVISIGKYVI